MCRFWVDALFEFFFSGVGGALMRVGWIVHQTGWVRGSGAEKQQFCAVSRHGDSV